jgi:isoleucyl-tRNA synthetase
VNIVFPEVETQVLKLWEDKDCFQKSFELSKDRPEFSFYDVSSFRF